MASNHLYVVKKLLELVAKLPSFSLEADASLGVAANAPEESGHAVNIKEFFPWCACFPWLFLTLFSTLQFVPIRKSNSFLSFLFFNDPPTTIVGRACVCPIVRPACV